MVLFHSFMVILEIPSTAASTPLFINIIIYIWKHISSCNKFGFAASFIPTQWSTSTVMYNCNYQSSNNILCCCCFVASPQLSICFCFVIRLEMFGLVSFSCELHNCFKTACFGLKISDLKLAHEIERFTRKGVDKQQNMMNNWKIRETDVYLKT